MSSYFKEIKNTTANIVMPIFNLNPKNNNTVILKYENRSNIEEINDIPQLISNFSISSNFLFNIQEKMNYLTIK